MTHGIRWRLWHLRRTNPHPGWDEQLELVVRAASEAHARQIAATVAGDEGSELWLTGHENLRWAPGANPQNQDTESDPVTCEPLEQDGAAGVVVRSFRAG